MSHSLRLSKQVDESYTDAGGPYYELVIEWNSLVHPWKFGGCDDAMLLRISVSKDDLSKVKIEDKTGAPKDAR